MQHTFKLRFVHKIILGLFVSEHAQMRLLYGAPVVLWVKRLSTELAVPCSRSAGGGNLFNRNGPGSMAHSLSLSHSHRPDMTDILPKRT